MTALTGGFLCAFRFFVVKKVDSFILCDFCENFCVFFFYFLLL